MLISTNPEEKKQTKIIIKFQSFTYMEKMPLFYLYMQIHSDTA